MADLSLQDVRDFNADLLAIHAAGVSLCFNDNSSTIDCSSAASLEESLQTIENTLGSAVANEIPLENILRQGDRVLADYGRALLVWHQTQRSPLALDKLNLTARAAQRERARLSVSLVQPFVWFVFAYCCLVFICTVVAPVFQLLSQQIRAEPSASGPMLNGLLWIRAAMPIWIVLIPVLLAMLALSLRARRKRRNLSHTRNRDGEKTFDLQAVISDRAYVAAYAQKLIASGATESELAHWLRSSAGTNSSSNTAELPALMKWAVSEDSTDPSTSRSRFWQASTIYGAVAQSLKNRSRNLIQPRLGFILIGGLIVLFVALTTFGPLVEMMLFVATSIRN